MAEDSVLQIKELVFAAGDQVQMWRIHPWAVHEPLYV